MALLRRQEGQVEPRLVSRWISEQPSPGDGPVLGGVLRVLESVGPQEVSGGRGVQAQVPVPLHGALRRRGEN